MPGYRYRLTPADLVKKSKNPIIQEYYGSNEPRTDGLITAKADVDRNVLINGTDYSAHVKKLTRESKTEEKAQEEFNVFIKEQLGMPSDSDLSNLSNLSDLNSAYSQILMYIIVTPLLVHPGIGVPKGRIFEGNQRIANLYREEKDGEIYFKTSVAGYNITTPEIAYLPAPVELLYKLEKGQFVLQYMKTDSALIRDVFLGKKISEEALTKQLKSRDFGQLTDAAVGVLSQHRFTNEKIQNTLLLAIQHASACQKGIISPAELKKALENLKPAIVEYEKEEAKKSGSLLTFFFQSQKPAVKASTLLQQAITTVTQLPSYKPGEEKTARSQTISNDHTFEEKSSVKQRRGK